MIGQVQRDLGVESWTSSLGTTTTRVGGSWESGGELGEVGVIGQVQRGVDLLVGTGVPTTRLCGCLGEKWKKISRTERTARLNDTGRERKT